MFSYFTVSGRLCEHNDGLLIQDREQCLLGNFLLVNVIYATLTRVVLKIVLRRLILKALFSRKFILAWIRTINNESFGNNGL